MFFDHPAIGIDTSPEFTTIPPLVYQYIANNCFSQLHITSITYDNIHHVMDSLVAYREFYASIGFEELQDQANYCLDVLANFLPDVNGKNREAHRLNNYRKPKPENLTVFFEEEGSTK